MKIGVLTYHRAISYGAVLQAIATRTFLESRGNDVYFVDYFPNYHQAKYRLFDIKEIFRINIIRSILYIYDSIRSYSVRKKRLRVFKPFIKEYIEPHCNPFDKYFDYDVVIYGSDQIWRKQPGLGMRFNPVYFGKGISPSAKKISYAASMGIINLNSNDESFLKQYLSNFSNIGVRESSLVTILGKLGIVATHNIDPTFLLSSTQWDELLQIKRIINEDYILYYKVAQGIDESKLEEFCSHKKLKLIKIYSYEYSNKSNYNPNPAEFLSLVKYASFVFTTSFHGLAFSLIYKKQFIVSCKVNSERITSLLDSINLRSRFVEPGDEFEDIYEHKIDYDSVFPVIETIIEDSKKFLLE